MSRVLDVPKGMSEYLLKGWNLTNENCPNCSMPMMRSPPHSGDNMLVCVNCKEPERGPEDSNEMLSVSTASDPFSGGMSTPPTDVTPPPSPPFVLPPPSEEMIRRRVQSDRASQEIGSRMLRGWTMLADECVNPTCYGIPLVRSPGSNPIKECVVCGNRYVPEGSSTTLLENTSTNVDVAPSKTKESQRQSSETPTGLTKVQPSLSRVATKAPKLEQNSESLPLVSIQLERSLTVLNKLLLAATEAEDVHRIGMVAESMSKVLLAIKAASTT